MRLTLTETERTELETAAAAPRRVRRWKRFRAVLVQGDGLTVAAVARTLGWNPASVSAWTAAWLQEGVSGRRGGEHGGGPVTLDAAGEAAVVTLPA